MDHSLKYTTADRTFVRVIAVQAHLGQWQTTSELSYPLTAQELLRREFHEAVRVCIWRWNGKRS